MHEQNPALEAIRRIVTQWLVEEGASAPASMYKIAAALIDARSATYEVTIETGPMPDYLAKVLEGMASADAGELTPLDHVKAKWLAKAASQPDELLTNLERAIERAEHKPGQWSGTLNSMGGVCSKRDGNLLVEDRWGYFSHKRDAWLAVAAVNALPELLARLRSAERGERSADHEVERLQRALGRLNGLDPESAIQKANCWDGIVLLLREVAPGWDDTSEPASLFALACAAIRKLAADLESWKRSERAQVEKIKFMQDEARGLREEIVSQQGELRAACQLADQLKDRLEIDPRHPYDGIAARDETIKGLQEQLDCLRSAFQNAAMRDVVHERCRQVEAEGWTPEHDDDHDSGDLAKAAAAYAMASVSQTQGYEVKRPPQLWPWDKAWWKPCDARRSLVKSGAMILAEIERLDRAAAKAMSDQQLAEDEQACRQAYDNTYHKIRPDMLYGEWRELWAKGETPAQLAARGRDATQG